MTKRIVIVRPIKEIDLSHIKWSLTPKVEIRYPEWEINLK